MSLILSGTNGLSDVDGTAATPAIRGTDTNTGIFFPAADTVAASVGGTEGLRLTSTGLGVGTSSPSFLLHASASSAAGTVTSGVRNTATDGNTRFALGNNAGTARATISLNNNSDEKMTIGPEGPFPMLFQTNGSERMRLDASGNLGLGVTPSAWGLGKAFEVGTVGNSIWGVGASNMVVGSNIYYASSSYKYANTGSAASAYQQAGGVHYWYTAPSGTAGNNISFTQAMTLDASGNLGVGTSSPGAKLHVAGEQLIQPTTATNAKLSMRHGSIGNNNYFEVDSSSNTIFATNNAERARITSGGSFLVGPSGSPIFSATGVAGLQKQGQWTQRDTAQPYGYIDYYYGAFRAGYILWNSGGLSLNSLSDVRMKQNIQDADSSLFILNSLQVRQFDWKSTNNHQSFGFIAQELNEVFPEAVGSMEDPELMWGVDNSKLVPVLVKAIQEQQAIIESLTARITALEAK